MAPQTQSIEPRVRAPSSCPREVPILLYGTTSVKATVMQPLVPDKLRDCLQLPYLTRHHAHYLYLALYHTRHCLGYAIVSATPQPRLFLAL